VSIPTKVKTLYPLIKHHGHFCRKVAQLEIPRQVTLPPAGRDLEEIIALRGKLGSIEASREDMHAITPSAYFYPMPLKPGHSQKIISQNIRELHEGPQFERTRKKFGAKKANAQAEAIALNQARRPRGRAKA